MISCTEFVFAYSELFSFIEKKEGYDAVRAYWERISDESINTTLGECIDRSGVRGCYEYWSRTLSEEAADFRIEYNDSEDAFTIEMRHCPSRGRLNASGCDVYHNYCLHCDTLYRRVAEARGLRYEIDLGNIGNAACKIRISRKQ